MPHVRHYKLQRIREVREDRSSPRVILHDGELWKVEAWFWVSSDLIRVTMSRWLYDAKNTIKIALMAHDAYVLRYRETRYSLRGKIHE